MSNNKPLPDEKWLDDIASMTWQNYFAQLHVAAGLLLLLGPNWVSVILLVMCLFINYRIRWFHLMSTFPMYSKCVTLYVIPLYIPAALLGWYLGFVETARTSLTFWHLFIFTVVALLPATVSSFQLRRAYPRRQKSN